MSCGSCVVDPHINFPCSTVKEHFACVEQSRKNALRPGSDAELFMSRTQFEFGPTQINKSTPVDSDAELN